MVLNHVHCIRQALLEKFQAEKEWSGKSKTGLMKMLSHIAEWMINQA